MDRPFRQEVKAHYGKMSLDSDQLKRLRGLQAPKKRIDWFKPAFAGFVVASLLFAAFLVINRTPMENRIFDEVVFNHNKQMPSEVFTENYAVIDQSLNRLDFAVAKSQRLASFLLKGGRYCSIQGRIAAQLHLEKGGKSYTLYQAAIKEHELPLPDMMQKDLKNTRVKMWREKELVFVLAETL